MRSLPFPLASLVTTFVASGALIACGPPCGGGSVNLALTNYSTNNNASHTAYQPGHVTATLPGDHSVMTIQTGLCVSDETDNREMTLFVHGTPRAGTSYPVSTATNGTDTFVTYAEGPTNGSRPRNTWRGRSGEIQIDSVQGGVVTFHVTGVLFEPDPTQASGASGTFQYDGTGRVTGVSGL